MESHDYSWTITADFGTQMPYEAVRQFACALDAAIIEAVERTISEVADGPVILGLTCGSDSAVERQLTFRKGYQIAEMPRAIRETAYATAAEAITDMQILQGSARAADNGRLLVMRDPSGTFRVGRQQRDGCDFESASDAESALRDFDDPSRFAVIPYVEISWSTDAEADNR